MKYQFKKINVCLVKSIACTFIKHLYKDRVTGLLENEEKGPPVQQGIRQLPKTQKIKPTKVSVTKNQENFQKV